MKNELALRYLLLRHLKALERLAPPDRFREVTHSLRVEPVGRGYRVEWRAQGRGHEQSFPQDAFEFYRRGDTRPAERSLADDLATPNEARARGFAEAALGVRAPEAGASAEPREPYARLAWAEAAALFAALGLQGDVGAAAAGLLAGALVVEQRGRVLAAALWLALAALGPPAAALAGALAYAALQVLDPDPTARRARLLLCGAALALAGWRLASPGAGLELSWGAGLAAVAATGLALRRSLFDVHYRALPLALPFYAAGLALDGLAAAAWLGLAVLAAGAAAGAFAHRIAPVQRERELTPNG